MNECAHADIIEYARFQNYYFGIITTVSLDLRNVNAFVFYAI